MDTNLSDFLTFLSSLLKRELNETEIMVAKSILDEHQPIPTVVVIDDLITMDYTQLEDRMHAHDSFDINHDNRFNKKPKKSTFTRKINRSTKRW
jgi:hypothetical protein